MDPPCLTSLLCGTQHLKRTPTRFAMAAAGKPERARVVPCVLKPPGPQR